MRIAFDVKGTIDGPKGELILDLFRGLQANGHECVVWSNLYSYAVDAVKNHKLSAQAMSKQSKGDLLSNGQELFDLCIEDDYRQTYLGAKQILFVDKITPDLVERLIKDGLSGMDRLL